MCKRRVRMNTHKHTYKSNWTERNFTVSLGKIRFVFGKASWKNNDSTDKYFIDPREMWSVRVHFERLLSVLCSLEPRLLEQWLRKKRELSILFLPLFSSVSVLFCFVAMANANIVCFVACFMFWQMFVLEKVFRVNI